MIQNLYIQQKNNKRADQPAYLYCICAFVACCLDSISIVDISEISRHWFESVLEHNSEGSFLKVWFIGRRQVVDIELVIRYSLY